MSYCTQADLVNRFSNEELLALTDRSNTGQVDSLVVEQAIADAASEINGYVLAAGYDLPLPEVPTIVRAYACDIARYRLYDDHAVEQVQKRYDDAVKFLRLLSENKVSLGIKKAGNESSSIGEAEIQSDRPSVFGGGF